ncbi:hypothetical protein [Bacillus mycoides]|nr:hypothetical protein [Bacillus mycoides]
MRKIVILLVRVVLWLQSACRERNIVDWERMIEVGGLDIRKEKKLEGGML